MMRFTMWGFCSRARGRSVERRGSVERRVGRGKGGPERGGLPPYLPLRPTPYVGVRSAAAGGTDRRACSSLICTSNSYSIMHIAIYFRNS